MELVNQALASRNEVSQLVLKNNETEDEKDNSFQAQFKAAVKSQHTKDFSEKTFGQLTPSQTDSARMSEVSYINLVDGPHSAQKYAKMHLPDYKWDRIRSTEHIAVFVNKKTGKVRLGFRGTQTLVDWKMNARTLTGTLGQSSQIKEMDKTINEIFDFYGRDKNGKQTMVELMSGHSKGGSSAFYFGELYGVDTHLQDPAIPVNEIFGRKTKAVHHVARTPGDVVSALSNVAVFRKGINITDLKQKDEGALKAHALSIMSGTDYEKSGNTAYNPELKSKAFLLQQLNKGKTTEEIVKEVGYSSKESRQELREEIKAIQATPETHEQVLKDSGFAIKQKPTSVVGKAKAKIGELVVDKVVPKIDAEIGKAVDKVAKVTSAGGIAGILTAVGASQALAALGSTNEVVNEGIVGSLSNAGQDAAASAYAHVRNRGHHVPVTNAIRNLPNGTVDSLLAESTSGAVRTAEQVSNASRMASMGTRALTSLTKGGVGGVLGAGVQIGAQAALEAMGMDEHTAKQVSRLAGAAAAGVLFGPEAVAIFVAIEAFTIAFEEIWNFFSPSQPELSPFEEAQKAAEEEEERILAEEAEILANPLTSNATQRAILNRPLTEAELIAGLGTASDSGYVYDPNQVINLFSSTPSPPPAQTSSRNKLYSQMTPEEQAEFINQSIVRNRENNVSNQPGYNQFDEYDENGTQLIYDSDDYYDENVDSDDYEDYDPDVVDEVVEEEVVEVEVPPPVADLTTEHIYSARQAILNTINKDPKITELRLAGNTHGTNKAIRELFMKNSHSSEYNGVTNYNDPQLPQLTPNNELIYQTFSAPTPTTETAKEENKNI